MSIMKKTYYLLLALVCGSMASCMDKDWSDPETPIADVYGNSSIKETNLVTIKKLKETYKDCFTADSLYKKINKSIQIKGVVTGNDIQGNMYKEISIQDETGGIFIGIAQGGVCGFLPIGTEILVELKGLHIGNYRKNPTIGTPTISKKGELSTSAMNRAEWQSHFTYTGRTGVVVKPDTFAVGTKKTKWNMDVDAGRLGTLVGVTISKGGYYNNETEQYIADIPFTEESTYALPPDYSTSWYFNEQPDGQTGGVQIYNSGYADFASKKLPHHRVTITGVFKRYKDQWEIIIRDTSDIVPCTDDIAAPAEIAPTGDGSQASPFNVAAALAKCAETGQTATAQEYYAVGYVTGIKSIAGDYKNAEFTISDTKDGDNELTVYRAKGPNKADITDKNLIKVGDKVVVCGQLINFKGNTPEFTTGCYIVSINQ